MTPPVLPPVPSWERLKGGEVMPGTDGVGRVEATCGGSDGVWVTRAGAHPPAAALGCQSRGCGSGIPEAAGAWQVDEKTTALMFPSAGNAAIGREGKRGMGNGGERGIGEGKGGTERCLQHPLTVYRQHRAPPGHGMWTQRRSYHSGGTQRVTPTFSSPELPRCSQSRGIPLRTGDFSPFLNFFQVFTKST